MQARPDHAAAAALAAVASPMPLQASVLFLRIADFFSLAAPEQARRRAALSALLASLVPLWPTDRRVVLETADGAALVSLDAPVLALKAAHQAAAQGDIAAALHHGPVDAVDGPDGLRLAGETIARAHAVAGLPGGVGPVATREFRQALQAVAPGVAAVLRPATDAGLYAQSLYEFDAALAQARRQRRLLLGLAAIAGILGAGAAVRIGRVRYAAAHRPAIVQLDIQPTGDVWVDGEFLGTAPPLDRLTLPPGRHTLEVRHARAKPLRLEVQLGAGEALKVEHVFTLPAPPAPPPQRPRSPLERAIDKYRFW